MFSIDTLNELQRKIALDTEGAILVSAGAGSGKNKTTYPQNCLFD